MTQHEWQLAVARAVGPSAPTEVDAGTRGCSTLDGNPIDPLDAFGAALAGEVRRVVVNGGGVVTDLGRAARLFTGSARDAALLSGTGCVWPGCDQTGSKIQVDHLIEWQHGGHTDQHNAGVLCRFHNRWKSTNNYRLHRDPDGT